VGKRKKKRIGKKKNCTLGYATFSQYQVVTVTNLSEREREGRKGEGRKGEETALLIGLQAT